MTTLQARVLFACKPRNLEEAQHEIASMRGSYPAELVAVAEIRELTEAEYDDFASFLLADRSWLAGFGGVNARQQRKVMAVSAPGRRTLFVDPSGYNYGRYVGFAVD